MVENYFTAKIVGLSRPYFRLSDGTRRSLDFNVCFVEENGDRKAYPTRSDMPVGKSLRLKTDGWYAECGLKAIEPGTGAELDLADVFDWDVITYWIEPDDSTSA